MRRREISDAPLLQSMPPWPVLEVSKRSSAAVAREPQITRQILGHNRHCCSAATLIHCWAAQWQQLFKQGVRREAEAQHPELASEPLGEPSGRREEEGRTVLMLQHEIPEQLLRFVVHIAFVLFASANAKLAT